MDERRTIGDTTDAPFFSSPGGSGGTTQASVCAWSVCVRVWGGGRASHTNHRFVVFV